MFDTTEAQKYDDCAVDFDHAMQAILSPLLCYHIDMHQYPKASQVGPARWKHERERYEKWTEIWEEVRIAAEKVHQMQDDILKAGEELTNTWG